MNIPTVKYLGVAGSVASLGCSMAQATPPDSLTTWGRLGAEAILGAVFIYAFWKLVPAYMKDQRNTQQQMVDSMSKFIESLQQEREKDREMFSRQVGNLISMHKEDLERARMAYESLLQNYVNSQRH